MDEAQVKALLGVATAYDNRKAGQVATLAWMEAARRGRWTFEAAVEAIHDHYATSTAFLMPGHITAAIRAQMRQPMSSRQAIAELEAASPAAKETRDRVTEMVAARWSMPEAMKRRRERRAQRRSAGDSAARERARLELQRLSPEEPPDDAVG